MQYLHFNFNSAELSFMRPMLRQDTIIQYLYFNFNLAELSFCEAQVYFYKFIKRYPEITTHHQIDTRLFRGEIYHWNTLAAYFLIVFMYPDWFYHLMNWIMCPLSVLLKNVKGTHATRVHLDGSLQQSRTIDEAQTVGQALSTPSAGSFHPRCVFTREELRAPRIVFGAHGNIHH